MRNMLKILYGVGLCMVTSIVVVTRAHTHVRVLYVQPCTTLHPYTFTTEKNIMSHKQLDNFIEEMAWRDSGFAIAYALLQVTSEQKDVALKLESMAGATNEIARAIDEFILLPVKVGKE